MSDEKGKRFTIDSEVTGIAEVPSITRLLNRKSLNLSKPTEPSPPPTEGVDLAVEPTQFHLESSESRVSEVTPATEIRRAGTARMDPKTPPLTLWKMEDLKKGADPMGRVLATLSEKGLKGAAFLAIEASAGKSTFRANAAWTTPAKLVFWTGLKWDPKVVPELWNSFVKTGLVELSPPSAHTSLTSSRNVVRDAFGMESTEWLTLVRVGSSAACRGVLALVSTSSIQLTLSPLLELLSKPV